MVWRTNEPAKVARDTASEPNSPTASEPSIVLDMQPSCAEFTSKYRDVDLHKLPPLKALKGFEAATRHQSIRDAADELCLTHPAVTHQVHLIEEALDAEFFAKNGRYITSTEAGRIFYPYVRSAFESLLEGVEAVHRLSHDTPLRIQTYVTASIRWLAKLIPQFLREHPDIKLALNTCAAEWEFDEGASDIGLIYLETGPDPERYHWLPLFEYALYPVCSPDLMARMGENPTLTELKTMPLIMINSEVHNWDTWFESNGFSFKLSSTYIMVDTLAVALELALSGEGVALVNGPFVERDLAEGTLVRPFDHKAICPGAWGLVCRKDTISDPKARQFVDWISQNAKSMASSHSP